MASPAQLSYVVGSAGRGEVGTRRAGRAHVASHIAIVRNTSLPPAVGDGMTDAAPHALADLDPSSDTSMHRDLLVADRATTEARIVSLERDWSGIVESAAMTGNDDEHDPEGATVAFERAQIETLIERARAHLDEIDDALERMLSGSYGRCEDCGQEIAPARLEARPFTTTCITCASRRR